jgi:hypothetical protein
MTDVAQDTFQVWDPKKLIRQSRDRRMFLFELYLVFSKEVKDSNGKSKYLYKMKMLVSPPQEYFSLGSVAGELGYEHANSASISPVLLVRILACEFS